MLRPDELLPVVRQTNRPETTTALDSAINVESTRGNKDQQERSRSELLAEAPIPMLWLFGKTGSGKSSIVRYLTGADDAEIGNGYRPQTAHSKRFSFPDEDVPIARFLDTRGLGEADYDATDDLKLLDADAQLMIVTVRVTDQAVDEVIKPLQQIRKANPHRPVLLALTALHDAYPGQQHAKLTPLLDDGELADSLPGDLKPAIEAQRIRFKGLFDRAVAIDLTRDEDEFNDGFEQPNYGGQQLKAAIIGMLPAAYRHSLIHMDQLNRAFRQAHRERCAPIILAHSILAASAAAVPFPWLDIPVVLAIQTRLAYRLARLNHQTLDSATLAQVSSAVGGRVALRMAVREALKIIPWVGMAANAAATFAFTYASGWSWNWYFTSVKQGHIPGTDELREIYKQQLKRGEEFWKASKDDHSA